MDWAAARATTAIAAVTAIVSLILIAGAMVPEAAVAAGFIPLRFEGAALPPDFGIAVPTVLTPLTATLVHGGLAHIAFNLIMLVYCGAQTERAIGARGIAVLYVVGAYAAAIAQYFPDPGSPMPMIGASGAISAIVGAYALLYGRRRAAKGVAGLSAEATHVLWLAAGWIGIQLLIGYAGMGMGAIAVAAHIGGFIAGLVFAKPLLLWRYRNA
ncbi:rhomboid family intramembrane serine protease [Sphingomonas sanguinis]|uniref:rhomboid family intramembrane serine protease n=1 Tax=Sphingomonas sp. LC-1 TaxID=3110957 RepID=UPI0021BB1915|nr:rhomboid family intramembrane serine protease [Sphingomonas sp. LC-1]MCT8003532.1 rhomboid family intramembrane serine protease [Sphingomonas sp. LC-1]